MKKNPIQVRLPLIPQKQVGLGDVISKVSKAIGIKPCAACIKRAEALNKRVVFRRGEK